MKKLKIKDNVDLKELEKYGFEKEKFLGYVLKGEETTNFVHIKANILNSRELRISTGYEEETLQLLDGLVEKVEE